MISKRNLFLPALLFCLALLLPAQAMAQATGKAVPVLPCRMVRALPHDPGAFTQGLFLLDGLFYESTGQYGGSSLRLVEPDTGRVLKQVDLPPARFGEGIAPAGEHILMLTWKSGQGLRFDRETLTLTGSFLYEPEGWGLAAGPDGRLYQTRGDETIIVRHPEDFRELSHIRVMGPGGPVPQLNELEWVEERLLVNIWYSDLVAVVDPESGRAVAFLDLEPLRPLLNTDAGVANGIAYDSQSKRLFVTGKNWDRVFEIAVSPQPW